MRFVKIVLLCFLAGSPIHAGQKKPLGELKPLFDSTLAYYRDLIRTPNGLYRDSYIPKKSGTENLRCSTAAVGVGLVALCVENQLGIKPERAAKDALLTLRTMNGKVEGFTPSREKSGYFQHFFSASNGAGESEFSTIDTAILVTGALFCRNHFESQEIRSEADELWNSVDWEIALAKPDGSELYMVIDDGKPRSRSITKMFNEYLLLAKLIEAHQLQTEKESSIVSIKDLTTWTKGDEELLSDPRKVPQSSFLVQFPFYLSHPCTANKLYQERMVAQARVDRASGNAPFWGAGAGVTPGHGYRAANFEKNPDRMVSPAIIAGFLPVLPEAREDLTLLFRRENKRGVNSPSGLLLPRFSLDHPDWVPPQVEAIDYSSMLYGLVAIHPDLGIEFFREGNQVTFTPEK